MLQLVVFLVLRVFSFFIDFEEAVEFLDGAGGAENVIDAAESFDAQIDGGLIEYGRIHLRGDEAHPDQPVKFELVLGQKLATSSGVRMAEVGRTASCASCASFLDL